MSIKGGEISTQDELESQNEAHKVVKKPSAFAFRSACTSNCSEA